MHRVVLDLTLFINGVTAVFCYSPIFFPNNTVHKKTPGLSQDSKPGTVHELEGIVARRKRALRDPGDQPLEVP